MAARYWRVVGLRTDGAAGLALTQAALWGASGAISATLSASHAPVSGTLASLTDGDLTDTTCWAQAQIQSAGFALVWDAGSAVDAVNVRFGGAASAAQWVRVYTLQSSSDGASWSTVGTYVLAWPSAQELSPLPSQSDPLADKVVALLLFDGNLTDGAPAGGAWTASGGAAVVASGGAGGSGALSLNGATECFISTPSSNRFAFGGGDFCVELYVQWDGQGGDRALVCMRHALQERYSNVVRLNNGVVQWSNGLAWLSGSASIAPNALVHVAVARSSGVLRIFQGGTKVYETADSTAIDGDRPCYIGAYDAFRGSSQLAGLIDFVRITSGAARYTADFTPPSGVGVGASYPPKAQAQLPLASIGAVQGAITRLQASAIERIARDMEFGGRARIWGTTKVKGVTNLPTRARVVLLRQRDKLLARETWSDAATGAFEFEGIDMAHQWLVLAEDQAGNYRPVAANRLEAQP